MDLLLIALILVGCGALGGVIISLLNWGIEFLPKKVGDTLQPGWLGNILAGAVAAVLSWALQGPYTAAVIFGTPQPGPPPQYSLSMGTAGAAVILGAGGVQWLTTAVNKKIEEQTARLLANHALGGDTLNPLGRVAMEEASPKKRFEIAKDPANWTAPQAE